MLKPRKDIMKIIESDLGKISREYNDRILKGLRLLPEKHIERGTYKDGIFLTELSSYFISNTEKLAQDLITELGKIQVNLNLKFRKSELLESKSIIIRYTYWLVSNYNELKDNYIKIMNVQHMANEIEILKGNIDNTVNNQIDILMLKNKNIKDKPEVKNQRKNNYIAIISIIVTVIIGIVAKLFSRK